MKEWVKNHKDSDSSSWDSGEKENTQQGRPKVDASKKRKPRFTMNLNEEELSLIQEAAESTGQSQAAFARLAALEKAKKIVSN